jgi:cysteinyl-tRNA synthetase
MTLSIYDTMRREKVPFETVQPGEVRLYVCGPTVYDKAHVGHAMSSLVFDIIRRYLEHKGYDVRHVMNYTDVDDKVIQRAQVLDEDPLELAEDLIDEYDQHLKDLNILPAQVFPRVSGEIDEIIKVVEGLIEKSYAYEVDGNVFFRVNRDEDYGRLSGRRLEEMRAGTRTEIDERKEDPADFALWKAAKPGEPSWESPWGPGRPGWHIECSAMALHHLGEQIDIHGGGNDLIFPHHENEIAQSESFTGKPFARFWVHNGMMQLGEEKMSKSLGNLVSVEEFLEEHEGDALRMMVLNSGYRKPLTFTDDVVQQAERALDRLRGALRPASPQEGVAPQVREKLEAQTAETRRGFKQAMDDDFNTAGALSHLFDLVRSINQSRDQGVQESSLKEAQATLVELAGVLGLRLDVAGATGGDIAPFIELMIEVRQDLREAEQWGLADRIRDGLAELGITLEDRKDGTIWVRDTAG